MRAILTLLATFALTGSGMLALTWSLLGPLGDGPHPTDHELMARLSTQRESFDALRAAAQGATQAGQATYVYGGSARSELSTGEQELLDRMRELDVDVNLVFTDGVPTHEGQQLQLAVHSRGLVTSGSLKGLMWSPTRPPGPLLSSLDLNPESPHAVQGCPEHETCVRHVEGDWYLFYSFDL